MVSYDGDNKSFSFIHNGKLTNVVNKENAISDPEENLNTAKIVANLRLGKYSAADEPSISGQITDVNAWCRSLTANEMIKWTNCDQFLPEPDLGKSLSICCIYYPTSTIFIIYVGFY